MPGAVCNTSGLRIPISFRGETALRVGPKTSRASHEEGPGIRGFGCGYFRLPMPKALSNR